jgi:hypothetical protein
MPKTYEAISSLTLSAVSSSITFSSIPQTFTDLILINNSLSASDNAANTIQFNSDGGSNYSTTYMYGAGSSSASGRIPNSARIYTARTFTEYSPGITHIMNYSNTTTYKSVLSRGNSPGTTLVISYAGLWRSTAAITSINITGENGLNYSVGSTFSLYGIKAA